MYNKTCTHVDTNVNRHVDDTELLLPLLEDVTVVKYRRLKNVPLKILCLSVFMLEAAGCSSVSLSVKLWRCCFHARLIYQDVSPLKICTRVWFQVDVSAYLADASLPSLYYLGSTNH